MYSTGNYIQYTVINYNGKEYEKEGVCVYIYITESLCYNVWQKLLQHCKSTINKSIFRFIWKVVVLSH